MTRPRKDPTFNPTTGNEAESTPCVLRTDGGRDARDHDGYIEENYEEHLGYDTDGFVSDEPMPEPTVYHEEYTDAYYVDSHLRRSYEGDPGPPWGLEDESVRPRGPPCRDCGEDTAVDSFGWAPDTGQTVDWATCEDCGLGWGPVIGWVDLDENSHSTKSDADER